MNEAATETTDVDRQPAASRRRQCIYCSGGGSFAPSPLNGGVQSMCWPCDGTGRASARGILVRVCRCGQTVAAACFGSARQERSARDFIGFFNGRISDAGSVSTGPCRCSEDRS